VRRCDRTAANSPKAAAHVAADEDRRGRAICSLQLPRVLELSPGASRQTIPLRVHWEQVTTSTSAQTLKESKYSRDFRHEGTATIYVERENGSIFFAYLALSFDWQASMGPMASDVRRISAVDRSPVLQCTAAIRRPSSAWVPGPWTSRARQRNLRAKARVKTGAVDLLRDGAVTRPGARDQHVALRADQQEDLPSADSCSPRTALVTCIECFPNLALNTRAALRDALAPCPTTSSRDHGHGRNRTRRSQRPQKPEVRAR